MKRIIVAVLAFVLVVSLVVTSAILLLFGGNEDNGGWTSSGGNNRQTGTMLGNIQDMFAAERTFMTGNVPLGVNQLLAHLPGSDAIALQDPRDGYILAPTLISRSGIDPLSSFVLQTSANYGSSIPIVTIDGQDDPTITREDNSTFLVTPSLPLTANSVYVFRLSFEDDDDITWAFQTAPYFEIISTLPAHQGTNVPIRTGIEITFSYGEDIDIADYFRIYPNVDGSFIHQDATTIFMPTNPLAKGQIYTITISPGISLPNSSNIITTEYVFSFETSLDTPSKGDEPSRIHFSNRMVEFPSFAEPVVHFWFNYNQDHGRPAIDMRVYQFHNHEQAIEGVHRLFNTPRWSARTSAADRLVDTDTLTNISTTTITRALGDSEWYETFPLPNNLPPGFYLVSATAENATSQMIIQITDLAVQVVADNDKTLLWIHDMNTGMAVSGATVYDPILGNRYESTDYGIAVVDRLISFGEYLIIADNSGMEGVVFSNAASVQPFRRSFGDWDDWGGGWGWSLANNDYWTVLQTDRTLFQRSDTLSLWGFVRHRHYEENITHVTAKLTEHSWWWDSPERDTLHRQNVSVIDGAYSGNIQLPNLDPGSYQLAIYHGDIRLDSTFFTVMDYVTPPYRLTVSTNKNAVFAGEEVVVTASTEFFEGTPVPDLELSYSFRGWELTSDRRGSALTNAYGVIEVSTIPYAENNDVQGERSVRFTAETTLPEMGWTSQSANVRVFVNDIDVDARASRLGTDATLTVDVHTITLDRLNEGSETTWNDFLDAPVEGQLISVEIIEIYWVPIRDGERYNFATRQVVPRYRHERRERSLEQFEITTDGQGHVTREFQVPNTERRSYQARLTTVDGNGRTITREIFIGQDFTWFHWNAEDDELFLDGVNEDGYDIGDLVELTVMQGTEAVTQGNILFVVVQNDILSYHLGTNPLTFTFGEQHVPNVQVYAYHFNGHTYQTGWQMSQRLRFNTTARILDIDISICQETYRPGEMSTITVRTTDQEGNPKPAHVNISLVNEALFALMDYNVDTLSSLYSTVSDSLRMSLSTHPTFISDGIDGGVLSLEYALDEAEDVAAESEPADGESPGVRERFEDTATFVSLHTNEDGEASFTFQLPDNITSWRITASAISNDLYAGNGLYNLPVSMPMFLHYTLNRTFLVGDTPYIGVNVYGSALFGGEEVVINILHSSFTETIYLDDITPLETMTSATLSPIGPLPDPRFRTATGTAFERINIPLWEMTEAEFGSLIIKATVGDYQDAVRHHYQVLHSHRFVETAEFFEVTNHTALPIPESGLTNITFMDYGQGQFVNDLLRMRRIWRNGGRIEGLVAKREATLLLETYFPDLNMWGDETHFDMQEYQTDSGGIAILPYASADLQTTVMLLPFISEDVNVVLMREYLYDIFHTSTTENRTLALYGLALLGEPVLLDLQAYAKLADLSVRDAAHIALGLAVLGETHAAYNLYNQHIAPHIQQVAPYYRVHCQATANDREAIQKDTSIVALLAAHLQLPERMSLHNYATRQRVATPLLNIERLAFITHEIENHTHVEASITYTLFGETITRELTHRRPFTLRIPIDNIGEFELLSVTGEVGAVSVVRTPLEDMDTVDSDITINRQFIHADTSTPATTFEQGDLVRVELTIDYGPTAFGGSYMITDFLPAGLVAVPHSGRFGNRTETTGSWAHVITEGQRITFFDFNGRFRWDNTYYYYARVINPGTFTAEGTLVQSFGAKEYMRVGENVVLIINP